MPQLVDDTRESLLRAGQDARRRIRSAWDDFCDFALRDNVLEVAVGLIIAASFTQVASSLVSDVILPIVSLLPFLNRNLSEKFVVLKGGSSYQKGHGYNTRKLALDDGAVVMAYGSFLDKILDFFGIGLALYTVAQVYSWASHDSIIKHTVKCKYCRKSISQKAMRCVNCTSWQDGREDGM